LDDMGVSKLSAKVAVRIFTQVWFSGILYICFFFLYYYYIAVM